MRDFSFEMMTDSSGQETSLSLALLLSFDEILSKKNALKETRELQMFGHAWIIWLQEMRSGGHGVYLALKEAPKKTIHLSLNWTFGTGNNKHRYSWKKSYKKKNDHVGEWFGTGDPKDGPPHE